MGVIRLHDQMALDKSAIQASDRNIDPVKNEPYQQHRQSDGAGLLDTGHW